MNDKLAEGIVGIGYSEVGEGNLLHYLKETGKIDTEMVSVYIDPNGKSIIKFGGFDKSGVKKDA